MSVPNSTIAPEPPKMPKPIRPYQFTSVQAILIGFIIAIVIELLLIRFTSFPAGADLAIAMLVYLFVTSILDSPMQSTSRQIFILVVIVILVVFFGYETYRGAQYLNEF